MKRWNFNVTLPLFDWVHGTTWSPAREAAWVLTGDRGITYADSLPENSRLVAGSWWAKDYAGPPLVSFEEDIRFLDGLKTELKGGELISIVPAIAGG